MADDAVRGEPSCAQAQDRLDALREQGAHRVDPVRFRLAESLARRALTQHGPARRVLDDKVKALLAVLADQAARPHATPADHTADVAPPALPDDQAPPAHQPGPLAGLVDQLARHRSGRADALPAPATGAAPRRDSPVDAETLQFFRRTWSRLNADQRLAQSRAALPDNAGPLNSQHLVHRALSTMRALSPEYFERFVAHVDALLWLERAHEQNAKDAGLPPRARGARKSGAGRKG